LLDIALEHIGAVETLPFHHNDPFDRLIISQGVVENLSVLSDDQIFDSYPIQRIW
jgi:PIN domain nuclease of toxin-antitoxin system